MKTDVQIRSRVSWWRRLLLQLRLKRGRCLCGGSPVVSFGMCDACARDMQTW